MEKKQNNGTNFGSIPSKYDVVKFNRHSFPADFQFGSASSAYQVEGAAFEYGRGPSIWDEFTHKYPERIADGSNGDVAVDAYHRYKEDVQTMKELGFDAYRFSISWSRILPKGKLSGGVNKEGISYYNNLINELLTNGIKPYVTLFHWDVPLTLENEYGGFLSHKIADDFKDYAEICFKTFGDRVKKWITVNEPWTFSIHGYAKGLHAPGRSSKSHNSHSTCGDSSTEPYIVSHNLLLAHANAVQLYRDNFQANQKGEIGITLISHWFEPFKSEDEHHKSAASRALDFMFGWHMDPITKGDYPESMRSLVKERLPKFTKEESQMLKGSFDFIGLNYYTANYASHMDSNDCDPSVLTDSLCSLTSGLGLAVYLSKWDWRANTPL